MGFNAPNLPEQYERLPNQPRQPPLQTAPALSHAGQHPRQSFYAPNHRAHLVRQNNPAHFNRGHPVATSLVIKTALDVLMHLAERRRSH